MIYTFKRLFAGLLHIGIPLSVRVLRIRDWWTCTQSSHHPRFWPHILPSLCPHNQYHFWETHQYGTCCSCIFFYKIGWAVSKIRWSVVVKFPAWSWCPGYAGTRVPREGGILILFHARIWEKFTLHEMLQPNVLHRISKHLYILWHAFVVLERGRVSKSTTTIKVLWPFASCT